MFYPYKYEEESNKLFVVLCDECPDGEYSGLSRDAAEKIVKNCREKGHQAFIYDQ